LSEFNRKPKRVSREQQAPKESSQNLENDSRIMELKETQAKMAYE
jgi:hypothetical protein